MDDLAADTALILALSQFTGMAPSRMATEVGVAFTTLTRPAAGKATTRLGRPTLEKLRVRWPDFPGWAAAPASAPEPTPNAIPFKMEGASAERMPADVPVYGTALGSDEIVDGEAIEQTTLNTGEVIGYLKRPVILDGRADVYGLYIQGSSMSPRFHDGEVAFAESKRPARIGDDVIVYLRHQFDGEDRTSCVLVKRLVRRSASYVELEQYSPAITFKIEASRVERIDRVIPWAELVS